MKKLVILIACGAVILFLFLRNNQNTASIEGQARLSSAPISVCGSPDAHLILKLMDTTRQMAPWMDNLGDYSYTISTSNERAQYFFNQGLTLYYGFNHYEAYRSFKEAARLDPQCAMAFWGQALALGPNINAPMDPSDGEVVYKAVRRAQSLLDKATPIEQKLVQAIAKRYTDEAPADRGHLDQAYADFMKQVVSEFPDDLDAKALYAESLMDLHPWDYWIKSGAPQSWTPEIVTLLEQILLKNVNHIMANHLYIHIMEASPTPDRAVASADRLREMIPGAGHLVHMPSHIYIRVGRYEEGILANKKAAQADEAYITQCKAQGIYPLGYYPHNYHFMWACAQMAGQGKEALKASQTLVEKVDISLMGTRDWATLQHYYASTWYAMMRFGKWNEIVKVPKPVDSLKYASAIWHYAQGFANLRLNKIKEVEEYLVTLKAKAKDPELEELKIWGQNSFGSVVNIAALVLEGEMLAAKKKYDQALQLLNEAVKKEDALIYQEPPDWHHPVRQTLGAVLLEAGKPAQAEVVFNEDLKMYRNNGWSLFGLSQSLEKQGRKKESAATLALYKNAFKNADVQLTSARK